MNRNKKARLAVPAQDGKEQKGDEPLMSFLKYITNMSKRQVRDLIVRVIEDAIILYIMGACIWAICWVVSEILSKIGVA